MDLNDFLREADSRYDSDLGLYGCTWQGPGYHSRVAPGTWAHQTRGNLDMAVFLLRSDRAEDHARACRIIDIILGHQDTEPYNPTYGIWPWLVEESLQQMSPPDYNWADFCGANLATILAESSERIPDGLRERMREALGHAGWSIFRRNVQPGYTNIAIMGACVTSAAGELLDEPRLADYGRRRLAAFLTYTEYHGGLNEYNSPTYTLVALHECERVLQLVRCPDTRASAEDLRRFIWSAMAERFHPATGQLAGPHSRAYGDVLSAGTATEIALGTGQAIPGSDPAGAAPSVVTHLPCPEELRGRFARLEADTQVVTRFIRREPDARSTRGTTWLASEACLGSVNADCLWIQRRPLIGYVKTPDGTAVLKVEFLRDGKPCAAAEIRTHQDRNRALSAFQAVTNKGDHHIHLDHPAGGIYPASDWRIRYRVAGGNPRVTREDANTFRFDIGGWRGILHTLPVRFNGTDAAWVAGSDAESAWVDAVLYAGDERSWPLAELAETAVGAGLEILGPGDQATRSRPETRRDGDEFAYDWDDLAVRMPALPFRGI